MYDIEQKIERSEKFANDKDIDKPYIDQLFTQRVDEESFPSLRVRDEVHHYHKQKWEKDFDILINEVNSIKSDASAAKDKLQQEYNDARTDIYKTPKRIPEEGEDINKLPWDLRSKVEALLITLFLITTIIFNAINVPKLLEANTHLFKENPYIAVFFIITVSLGIIGYKLAETKFDVLARFIPATTLWASRGIFTFSFTAILSFLAMAHLRFESTPVINDFIFTITGQKFLSMTATLSVFLTEICTTFIFTKSLLYIIDQHGRKDIDNPRYVELKDTIKKYIDLENTEKKTTILADKIKDLKINGLNNYVQRADAYLVSKTKKDT